MILHPQTGEFFLVAPLDKVRTGRFLFARARTGSHSVALLLLVSYRFPCPSCLPSNTVSYSSRTRMRCSLPRIIQAGLVNSALITLEPASQIVELLLLGIHFLPLLL